MSNIVRNLFIWFRYIFFGLFFLAIFILAIKNRQEVVIKFFLEQEWHAPLSLVLSVVLILGMLIGTTITWFTSFFIMKKREKHLRQKLEKQYTAKIESIQTKITDKAETSAVNTEIILPY